MDKQPRHQRIAELISLLQEIYNEELERTGKEGLNSYTSEIEICKGNSRPVKKLELSDTSLNFDYAHFLPNIEKCATLHGHSSLVRVEVEGVPSKDGIVIDFGLLKSIVKRVLSELDHKLIVCDRYVKVLNEEHGLVEVVFNGLGGSYHLILPASQVTITSFESSVENLSEYIAKRIASRMPSNVHLVRVSMTEGFNKSAFSYSVEVS